MVALGLPTLASPPEGTNKQQQQKAKQREATGVFEISESGETLGGSVESCTVQPVNHTCSCTCTVGSLPLFFLTAFLRLSFSRVSTSGTPSSRAEVIIWNGKKKRNWVPPCQQQQHATPTTYTHSSKGQRRQSLTQRNSRIYTRRTDKTSTNL